MIPAEKLKRALQVKRRQIERARECPAALCEYVLRHEKTGRRILNAPFHAEWHQFFSDNDWGVLICAVEHGKTQQIAVGRILWEIGRNPAIRVALVQDTVDKAAKTLGVIRTYIERSDAYHEVFPDVKRSTREKHPWHQYAIEVERDGFAKDPTVQAYGSGSDIVGIRTDLVVLDDILNFDNSRTEEARQKTLDWFDTTVLTRVQDEEGTGEHGRCWLIGTPWHPEDILHVLKRRGGFGHKTYSAVHNPDDSPKEWRPVWPAQWSLNRLLKRMAGMTPHNFARKYLARAVHDLTSRFPEAVIQRALMAGRGYALQHRRPRMPNGRELPCFTGVDIGIGQKEKHDLSVILTIALDERFRRILVQIESGRWPAQELIDRIVDAHWRFESKVVVENNAAQDFIRQFVAARSVPVTPFQTTGRSKFDEHFGVESIAVEMRQGLWVFPSPSGEGPPDEGLEPEVAALIANMRAFHPESHTGDRLMALWFAREGARKLQKPRSGRSDHMVR